MRDLDHAERLTTGMTGYPGLATITKEWSRIGVIGFGGPPAHISLLRRLCVEQNAWISEVEFEDAIATTNLLPGPASTQLAIYCAWRLRGTIGGILGGICFIFPGLVLVVALSAVFLARHPPDWVLGAAAGAGAAVPAVACFAAWSLIPASRRRVGPSGAQRTRWVVYAIAGAAGAALAGQYLVLVMLACGLFEIAVRLRTGPGSPRSAFPLLVGAHAVVLGGLTSLVWVAFKVGALSYGGGFVIVPLMQHDAVTTYHWMTGTQFLNAVAIGQVTPGPVVLTTAVVGYAARGITGALVATAVAFAPSFSFILAGGRHFGSIRSNRVIQSFLTGAGPAVVGAIAGSAIPLGRELNQPWQVAVLAGSALWLFGLRKSVPVALLVAGTAGALLVASGIAV
jgi:chromate transporter